MPITNGNNELPIKFHKSQKIPKHQLQPITQLPQRNYENYQNDNQLQIAFRIKIRQRITCGNSNAFPK